MPVFVRVRDGRPLGRLAVLAFGLVLLAVATISFGIRVGVIRWPDPRPIPGPVSPTPPAILPQTQTHTFRYGAAGFDITLPSDWRITSGSDETTFEATRFDLRVEITSGDPGGRIQPCRQAAGSWEDCSPILATGIGPLVDALRPGQVRIGENPPTVEYGETTLNGEPAQLIRIEGSQPGRRAQYVTYVAAIHEGRPYLVRFSSALAGAMADVGPILARFHFVHPVEGFTPSDPEMKLEWFEDPNGEYRLQLPHAWIGTARSALDASFPGASAWTFGQASLKVSFGPSGGMTLGDLEDLLVSVPPMYPFREEVHDYRFLGGALAGVEQPIRSATCLGCPTATIHVYAVRDGRAVVLAFDYWTIRFDRLGPDNESQRILNAIIESFEFTS
jgi:hypothetical protein